VETVPVDDLLEAIRSDTAEDGPHRYAAYYGGPSTLLRVQSKVDLRT